MLPESHHTAVWERFPSLWLRLIFALDITFGRCCAPLALLFPFYKPGTSLFLTPPFSPMHAPDRFCACPDVRKRTTRCAATTTNGRMDQWTDGRTVGPITGSRCRSTPTSGRRRRIAGRRVACPRVRQVVRGHERVIFETRMVKGGGGEPRRIHGMIEITTIQAILGVF